jgi:hypothetical protein
VREVMSFARASAMRSGRRGVVPVAEWRMDVVDVKIWVMRLDSRGVEETMSGEEMVPVIEEMTDAMDSRRPCL